jgi:quercetin dioxygenase-like cupin family protein
VPDATSSPLPSDDPARTLAVVDPDDPDLPHVGMVGDTYTVLVGGDQTAGAYTLIDMLVPPGGGPGPHRHDFEELFVVLEGAIEVTFRGQVHPVAAGQVVNVPANAPHFFRNAGTETAHLLCMCTPAAQDGFFLEVGTPLPRRDSAAPRLEGEVLARWVQAMSATAPRYRTQILPPPDADI